MVAAGPKDPGPATRHDEQRRWQGRGYIRHLVGQCPAARPAVLDYSTAKAALAAFCKALQGNRPMTTQTPAGPRPRTWHDNLEASGLLPGEHAADSGYVSADLLVSCRLRSITLLGPCWPVPPPRPGPVATPRTCSPSTGTAARPPARSARSAANS